jgi:hypothetical protein
MATETEQGIAGSELKPIQRSAVFGITLSDVQRCFEAVEADADERTVNEAVALPTAPAALEFSAWACANTGMSAPMLPQNFSGP